jgi:ketosteroid isomerase-like protein
VKNLIPWFLVIILVLVTGCNKPEPIDLAACKVEVEAYLSDFWKAFENKDLQKLSEMIGHDPDLVFFGTDENERWAGWEVVREALTRQFGAFIRIQVKTHNNVVQVSPTGNTAWFSLQRYISIVTSKGSEEGMKTRVTGVLEKRDGRWQLVQYHSSYPITDWEKFKY